MAQDLFGHEPPESSVPAFKDIRDQREVVAEEKAVLCAELNRLCKTPPPLAGRRLDQPGQTLASCTRVRAQDAEQQDQQPAAASRGHQRDAGFRVSRPPFPTIAGAKGIKHARPPRIPRLRGLVPPAPSTFSIAGRERGEADMHRRDAIRRGGI